MDEPESATAPGSSPMRDRSAFVLVVVGTFGLQALTMVTGIITARLLGVEGRGQTALVFALGLTGSQLTLGGSLPNAIAKGLAERGVAARDGLRRIARRRAVWLLAPCLASGAVMLFLQRADPGGDKYALAVAVLVMTFQTITFRLLVGSLQGEVGHLGRMAVVGMVPQLLFTVVLVVAVVAGWDWDVYDVIVSFFVASFIGLGVGFASLATPTRRSADQLDESELWAVTRQTYVSSVRPLDSIGLDRIMVGGLLGNAALGLYAAATAISNLCSVVGNAVAVIVLPRIAMTHDDPAAQRELIRRWVGFSVVIITLVVAGLEVVVGPAIRIAFGEEFSGAVETARWLVLADGLLGLRKVLIAVLQGQGRGAVASWIELVLTVVLVAGIVVASLTDHLPAIGITLTSVGVLSCLALGLVIGRSPERDPGTVSASTRV